MYDDVMSKGSLLDQDMYFRKFRSPCRKTCSTTHNPMYHCSRWNQPMRPQSAEGSKAKKQEEALKSDWQEAGINAAVRELEAKEKMQELKHKMQQSGYNSENEKSSDLLRLYPADTNHSELEDMMNLLKKAKTREEQAQKKGVLKEPEVDNYYKVVKANPEQFTRDEIKTFNIKSWLTLEYLMNSLNLKKEFDILFESQQQKIARDEKNIKLTKPPQEEIEANENENLIKILIRCKKMYECYQEIVRILVKVKKRKQLIE